MFVSARMHDGDSDGDGCLIVVMMIREGRLLHDAASEKTIPSKMLVPHVSPVPQVPRTRGSDTMV